MNFKYIKNKYKKGLRLWVLCGSVLWLGACAYDPNDGAESNSGEPQSRIFSDNIGRDLVVLERLGAAQIGECRDFDDLTR